MFNPHCQCVWGTVLAWAIMWCSDVNVVRRTLALDVAAVQWHCGACSVADELCHQLRAVVALVQDLRGLFILLFVRDFLVDVLKRVCSSRVRGDMCSQTRTACRQRRGAGRGEHVHGG